MAFTRYSLDTQTNTHPPANPINDTTNQYLLPPLSALLYISAKKLRALQIRWKVSLKPSRAPFHTTTKNNLNTKTRPAGCLLLSTTPNTSTRPPLGRFSCFQGSPSSRTLAALSCVFYVYAAPLLHLPFFIHQPRLRPA